MKKKIFCLFLTMFIAAAVLSGCQGGKSEENTKGDKETAGGSINGEETMTVMAVGTAADAYKETYQAIADEFSADNEYGVTVKFEFYENEQYKTKLTTLMASNSVPDIFITWELSYLQPFVEGGKVYSLQEAMESDTEWKNSFSDGVLEPLTFDEELYAIPTQKSFCVMFYNKQIFEENNVQIPKTYEEFLDLCETLKGNGVTPMALAATDAWIPAEFVQQISNGIGGMDLYKGIVEGTRKWNDPVHVEAAGEAQEMVEKGYFQEGMLGMSNEEARSQFMNGKIAMYFMGAWEASNFISDDCAIKDVVSAFTLPAKNPEYDNISVGSVDTNFAISEGCKNKEAAIAFLKYYSSVASQEKVLYEQGRLPSAKVDIDAGRISPLVADLIELSNESAGLTPWWDRAFGAGEGVEFNNQCLAVFGGDDVKTAFDELQRFADENANQ